ncbi:MAG: hypothetical protein JNL63_11165 [Bacteroidia bacterium]|nr:hypothetical protein [Bacteroidia bacterium]
MNAFKFVLFSTLLVIGGQSCKTPKVIVKNHGPKNEDPAMYTIVDKSQQITDSIARNSIAFYIPKETDPVKTIRINFNIFQDDSGYGNFRNVSADIERLNNMFHWLNGIYGNNPAPSDPIAGVIELHKTHIQFELNGVFYYKNSGLINSINSYELLQEIKKTDPKRMDQLNVCFTNGKFGTASGLSSLPTKNLNADMYIVSLNFYNNGKTIGDFAATTNMAHEFGHAFDLVHTYMGGGASPNCATSAEDSEYLDDVFGQWPGNCPHFVTDSAHSWGFDTFSSPNDRRTNNIMGGFQSSSYFSPKQIGMMHRALAIKTPKRYIR